MGNIFYIFNSKEREYIEWNILRVFVPTTPPADIKKIIHSVYQGIYFHYCEKLINAYYGINRIRSFLLRNVTLSGSHLIEKELNKGNKVILVTAHYGGIEFLPLSLSFRNFKVAMMVHYKTQQLKKVTEELGRLGNVHLIDVDENNSFTQAITAVKEGSILLTEFDEIDSWSPSSNKYVEILGHKFFLDRSIDILQRRTGAVILIAFVKRLGKFKYVVEISRPEDYLETENEISIQGKLLKVFERNVYKHPDHWYEWKKLHKMVIDEKIEPRPNNEAKIHENFEFHNIPHPASI